MDFYEALSIGFYLLLMLGIGVYSFRKSTSTSDEFLISGRKLGPVVTALSAGAADMSGWLLMGVPGAMYFTGISSAWIAIGLTIGAYFNYLLIAPRLRIYTEVAQNSITLPVFFENRYKDKTHSLKFTSSAFILIFFTLYTSAGMVSGGKLFESAFGMDYLFGVLITGLVVVLYTFLGGFLAVSLTDFVQGTIMVLALVIVPLVAIFQIGSPIESFELISQKDSKYLDLFTGTSFIGIISLIGWGLGYFGQPHILVRFMAIEKPADLVKARRVGISWMVMTLVGAMLVGLIGIAYLMKFDHQTMQVFDRNNKEAETIFIYFARKLFHPLIGGFLLTAILAAVMSTISSQLLVTSSSLVEDIYKTFVRKQGSEKEFLAVGRISVLLVAVVAMVLSLHPHDSILNLVGNAWAGFGAAFGPMILLALLNPKSTAVGAFAGMMTGGLVVLGWVYLNHPFKDVYEIIPGFFSALLVNLVISKLTYQPIPEVQDEFKKVASQTKDAVGS